MIFSLEALDAANGDCLFLHFGPWEDPQLIIIDGGPQFTGRSTFTTAIEPRLEEMSDLLGVPLPLPTELLMVSHIDDDHIGGVIKLLKRANGSSNPLVDIVGLWHNAFDDFLDTNQLAALAAFGRTTGNAAAAFDAHTLSAAAGVKQGLKVRDAAADIGLDVNAGTTSGFVASGDVITIGDLTLTIIGPRRAELEALQDTFDDENPNVASMTASDRRQALASFTDKSVANLASIVILAEQDGKTMLLTGDARGDKIIKGLEDAGLLTNGKITVDILKIPHHGSDHNVSTDFFRRVKAKNYVFSGDGSNGNPEAATIGMITTARRSAKYTMWFTHQLSHIEDFVDQDHANNNRKYDIAFRESGATSLWVDLAEALDY